MTNNSIEQRDLSPFFGETGEPFVDPYQKIQDALPNLPSYNARFVEAMLSIHSNTKPEEKAANLIRSLSELVDLATTPKALKRQEERQSVQRFDLMEIVEPFNPEEKIVIAENLTSIQLADGCTVGCAFCGVEAKQGVSKSVSKESFESFVDEFGEHFPRRLNGIYFGLYEDSDPFDWVSEDGEDDYTDLAHYFLKHTSTPLCTSTSVPQGSELSIAEFLVGYTIRNYDRARKKQRRKDMFRFSVTKDNKERVERIMQFVMDLKFVPDDFLKAIVTVVDRSDELTYDEFMKLDEEDVTPDMHPIRRVGYFVHKSDRGEDDISGIECQDGLTIVPFYSRRIRGEVVQSGGVIAKSLEAVTLRSTIGARKQRLLPGLMEIPEYVSVYENENADVDKKRYFPFLQKLAYKVYENGVFKGKRVEESVRRDALAFYFAYRNITNWDVAVRGEEDYDPNSPPDDGTFNRQLEEFMKKFRKRKKSSLSILDSESDPEAVEAVRKYVEKIEEWVNDLERRAELQDSHRSAS
ncbi:MAG: hypothetical protein AAB531_01180 [Patescibacteria group bacterium]